MSKFLDRASEFFAHRKGLLPIIGLVLILANLLIRLFFPASFLAATDLFLHVGLVVAIFGLMLAWAL